MFASIYRAKCRDGSGLDVGPGRLMVIPPPPDWPHPWAEAVAPWMANYLVVLTLLYLLPGVIAWGRRHPQRLAIRLFTLIAG